MEHHANEEDRLIQALKVSSVALIFTAGFVAGGRWQPPVQAQEFAVTINCGTASAAQIRTTLYFGLSRPKGSVSELEWQIFLRDEVTKRFPDGLTAWQAEGQWLTPTGSIDREQSKVVLLVHADTRSGAGVGAGGHPGVPQNVRAAIGSVGKLAGVRRGLAKTRHRRLRCLRASGSTPV